MSFKICSWYKVSIDGSILQMGKVSRRSQSNLPKTSRLVAAGLRAQRWPPDSGSPPPPLQPWDTTCPVDGDTNTSWRPRSAGVQRPWGPDHSTRGLEAPGLFGTEPARGTRRQEPTLGRTTSALSEKVALGIQFPRGFCRSEESHRAPGMLVPRHSEEGRHGLRTQRPGPSQESCAFPEYVPPIWPCLAFLMHNTAAVTPPGCQWNALTTIWQTPGTQ